MKKSDERMIVEIGAILNDMGMNPKLKGFRYWIMIIFYCIKEPAYFYDLTKLYDFVGSQYGLRYSTIANVIRIAKRQCLKIPQTYNIFENKFGKNVDVTNTMFIKYVIERLKEKCC